MSKQINAKLAQGYCNKPVHPVCSNCKNFASDMVTRPSVCGGTWTDEKNIRCTLGGFAVKKMATCKMFKDKDTP